MHNILEFCFPCVIWKYIRKTRTGIIGFPRRGGGGITFFDNWKHIFSNFPGGLKFFCSEGGWLLSNLSSVSLVDFFKEHRIPYVSHISYSIYILGSLYLLIFIRLHHCCYNFIIGNLANNARIFRYSSFLLTCTHGNFLYFLKP